MALTVTFRAKPDAWGRIVVPTLTRSHCDMNAFRQSRAFGSYANSDLFVALLTRSVTRLCPDVLYTAKGERRHYINVDALPTGVSIQRGSLLATVTLNLPDER